MQRLRRKARRIVADATGAMLQACISSARETSWFEDGSVAEFSVGPEWTNLSAHEAAAILVETEPTNVSANGWPWWTVNGQVRVRTDEDGYRTYTALAWQDVA